MLRITGGKVFDPANGIDGVIRDVCICDGKIVPTSMAPHDRCHGMAVFPAASMHTTWPGGLNFARAIPEDHRRHQHFSARRHARGSADDADHLSPVISRRAGYTTVNEARAHPVGPAHARGTRDIPIVDKSPGADGHQLEAPQIEAGELERAQHIVAWNSPVGRLAYGVKAVNPGRDGLARRRAKDSMIRSQGSSRRRQDHFNTATIVDELGRIRYNLLQQPTCWQLTTTLKR